MKPKIACAMIIRGIDNELPMLKRCLKTVSPYVDATFITLTDPNKKKIQKTLKWCKKQGIYTSYFKWIEDFGAARNYNWQQVPKDYEWIFWCDTDDIVVGANHFQDIIENAELNKIDAVFMRYLYSVELDEEGRIKDVLVEHRRERLVRNGKYKWVSPIHEVLVGEGTRQIDIERLMGKDICRVVHLTDHKRTSKALQRNIKILKRYRKETKDKDPRPIYYLAKAYVDLGGPENLKKAIPLLNDYLAKSGWAEERGQAWEYLAEIYREFGAHNKSIKCCLNALQEGPDNPSVYLNLALCYCCQKQWDKALFWVKLAAKVPVPKTTLVISPHDLVARSLEIIWHVAINKNMLDEAYAAVIKQKEMFPDNEEVEKRYQAAVFMKEQKEVTRNIMKLCQYLRARGEEERIKPLISAIPSDVQSNPVITRLRNTIMPPKDWKDNEIAVYVGPCFTPWTPKNLDNPKDSFLGGSEEAVIYLCREMAKRDWKITVYADPGVDAGKYDGVSYRPYYEFNPKDNFNILVSWRNAAFFDDNYKSKKNYVWAHDVLNPLDFTEKRLGMIDKIIVQSKAHRETASNVPDDKFLISTNGYFEHNSNEKPKNNPKWCIWTSSYDRGLEHLLKIWPDVVKEVPEAKLHIFYGWKLFNRFYGNNPERMAWKAKMEKMMTAKGITHHGRVSQPEIERWYKRCGIFAYPSHFYEINCISAFKAELWGAVPITMDYAALKETVQFGEKIKGDIYDPDTLEEYKKTLIDYLKHPEKQEKIRPEMMKWARNTYGWDRVADQWIDEFRGMSIEEAKKTVLSHNKKWKKYLPTTK